MPGKGCSAVAQDRVGSPGGGTHEFVRQTPQKIAIAFAIFVNRLNWWLLASFFHPRDIFSCVSWCLVRTLSFAPGTHIARGGGSQERTLQNPFYSLRYIFLEAVLPLG